MSKLSAFTTVTLPEKRCDPWKEAITNYLDFFDEVVVVCGHKSDEPLIHAEFGDKVKTVYSEWPHTWDWNELPKHFNMGLEKCTGDVIVRLDIDYFIHEADKEWFKIYIDAFSKSEAYIARTVKFNVMNKNVGMIKSRIPNIINAKYKDRITFGKAVNKNTDWTVPLVNFGGCRKPRFEVLDDDRMPLLRIRMYNYDYFFKTEEITKAEFWRFAQAYETKEKKGEWSWGATEEKAWGYWRNMMEGRLRRSGEGILSHPKYIRDRIKNMPEEEFGNKNFNLIMYR